MAFYYISAFSIVPLGIAYLILALISAGVVVVTRGIRIRGFILASVAIGFLLLPISEELWIAWNFAQACKQAGTFIYKKVQVEGFYDDTSGWGPRQISESRYQFVESRDILSGTLLRVERTDDASRQRALAWHAERNPPREDHKSLFIVQPLNDKEQVVVSPDGRNAWRVTKIARPTARYQFRHTDPMNGTPWGHKIIRYGSVVIDTQTSEEIARYTRFGRGAPWYFIGLDVPSFACDAPGRWPFTKGTALIYREALIPIAK